MPFCPRRCCPCSFKSALSLPINSSSLRTHTHAHPPPFFFFFVSNLKAIPQPPALRYRQLPQLLRHCASVLWTHSLRPNRSIDDAMHSAAFSWSSARGRPALPLAMGHKGDDGHLCCNGGHRSSLFENRQMSVCRASAFDGDGKAFARC